MRIEILNDWKECFHVHVVSFSFLFDAGEFVVMLSLFGVGLELSFIYNQEEHDAIYERLQKYTR